MDLEDRTTFLIALNTTGEFFSDELSELRQQSYWSLFHDRCTLEEWQYACTQAMAREIFHKMPLPAVLLDYVRELRQAKRDALPSSPSPQEVLALRESLVSAAEVRALIASVWPDLDDAPRRPAAERQRSIEQQQAHLGQDDAWPIERKG